MKLHTYEVITDDLTFLADVGEHRPMKLGQIVYEWPYPDWGMCGPDDIAVVLTPMDVLTVYAVPRSTLLQRDTVDLTMAVHEGMERAPTVIKHKAAV
jgi:hypothetical protein